VTPRLANRRIRLLLVFFTLAFLGTFGRAVWLQAVQAQPLDRLAQGQHHVTIDVPAARGSILDRNGVNLAIGRQAITVYANPRHVTNPRPTAIAVGRALHLDAESSPTARAASSTSPARLTRSGRPHCRPRT